MNVILKYLQPTDQRRSVTQIDAEIRKIVSKLNEARRPEDITLQDTLHTLDGLKNERHKRISTKGYIRMLKMLK